VGPWGFGGNRECGVAVPSWGFEAEVSIRYKITSNMFNDRVIFAYDREIMAFYLNGTTSSIVDIKVRFKYPQLRTSSRY
jgi:hypothetical protein